MKIPGLLLLAAGTGLFAQQGGLQISGRMITGAPPTGPVLNPDLLQQPVTGQPYSAQAITETRDGDRITSSKSAMRYRDSQGRQRREEAPMIFLTDPVTRTGYVLNQSTRTATKIGPLPPSQLVAPSGASLGVVILPPVNQADLVKNRGLDHGAFVSNALEGSPAEKAGILSNDVILSIEGLPVKDSEDLSNRVGAFPPGRTVTIALDRGGKRLEVKATLEARSEVFGTTRIIGLPVFARVEPQGQPQTKTQDLGSKLMEGVLVEGKRTTTTLPAGQLGSQPVTIVSETWYSPDLQIDLLVSSNDPRTGESVFRLTNITRSEPAASLFQVPRDYSIVQSPASPRFP